MKPTILTAALLLIGAASPVAATQDAYRAFIDTKVAVWMANPVVIKALTASSTAHAGLAEADVLDLDALWRNEIGSPDSPLITQVMTRPASDYLRDLVAESQGAIAEIILMDDHGLNAAISSVTSDFWQGDEAKFQQTYDLGPGSLHIGEVERDESTGIYVVQVSVPVTDATGALIGAVTFSLDAERL